MKKLWFLSLAAMVIFLTSGIASSGEPAKNAKEVFEKRCSTCHGLGRATSAKKNPDEWNKTVQRMKAKKNANITDEEAKIITEYLSETYKKEK
ncbi:MAG TPA: photosystem P840 reaction-center cytochrome c-551 [Syntrophorhabdaceae bacterium]|nr:photosystem P840 reaction-center cytochrome c-551 [Syntrophorhabdaceae bacterium]HOT42288.1 photosystem P840 reaction-center cytochrome c-551 [Syntrophorhabdaceae bacterium]HPC66973.1 photosystem P840 reaction-center cytochrome c-551 [Syntrophorhabdaceae bacterium]HPP42400.1 photosystem P840 reaction-center cytochrome c-551 [Syntrophorhabdaceae bacterium]HQE80623.1 photosystem P840 reaction-center cytochrome c-551 [Syntrophorhabdaceae bacterium]